MSYVPWSLTSQKMGGGGYSLNPGDLFPPRVTEEMKARQMVPDWEKQRVPFTHLCPVPTAGCWELVNTWCSLVILTAHLRQRGQVPPDEGDDGAPTRYESLLENLDDQCPELAGESHTTAPGGGCAFSPPPIDRASWAFQRSFAACQAYNPQVMAGGGARALGVTTRSKAPFQSHEGRDPCHPGPVSWGQEPGKEETQTPGGMLTPRSPSEQTYVC
ncbi:uncharacterized protein C22orf15 homolog isoform X1 [Neofelis nebulosa]|uniref:uncharacterized protein C22orf15 homolog isoform X1 n=1 Tax=Neofelis nebulosa TaxID=61452 RepID=UPI00272D152B|nr:uncharacterized protein C22orf15 homolog isoform X1 [Neofelis nebulosa]